MGLARHVRRLGTKIRDVRTLVFVAVLHGSKRFEKCLVRIMGLLQRAAKGSDGRPEGVCQWSRNPHVGGFCPQRADSAAVRRAVGSCAANR